MSVEPIFSKKKMPDDDVPRQMVTLPVELLRSGELPELAIGGAWRGVDFCLMGRPGLGPVAMELSLIELAAEHIRAIGSPADIVSISRGRAGRGLVTVWTVYSGVIKAFAGQAERPDLAAFVASGLFDLCVEVVVASRLRVLRACATRITARWHWRYACSPRAALSLGARPRSAAQPLRSRFAWRTRWTTWKSWGARPAPSPPGSAAVSSAATKAGLSSASLSIT